MEPTYPFTFWHFWRWFSFSSGRNLLVPDWIREILLTQLSFGESFFFCISFYQNSLVSINQISLHQRYTTAENMSDMSVIQRCWYSTSLYIWPKAGAFERTAPNTKTMPGLKCWHIFVTSERIELIFFLLFLFFFFWGGGTRDVFFVSPFFLYTLVNEHNTAKAKCPVWSFQADPCNCCWILQAGYCFFFGGGGRGRSCEA